MFTTYKLKALNDTANVEIQYQSPLHFWRSSQIFESLSKESNTDKKGIIGVFVQIVLVPKGWHTEMSLKRNFMAKRSMGRKLVAQFKTERGKQSKHLSLNAILKDVFHYIKQGKSLYRMKRILWTRRDF